LRLRISDCSMHRLLVEVSSELELALMEFS